MSMKNLLDCVRASAAEHIGKLSDNNNASDRDKILNLFEEKRFESKGFDPVDLNVLNFCWEAVGHDRNWWWQIQALPFLNWFCSSFDLHNSETKTAYYELCRDAIIHWARSASGNKNSPLVWHDHASAFRVRNITNWVLFCYFNGIDIRSDPKANEIFELISRHMEWLSCDANFSRHTNHGFDQAMIALRIGCIFHGDDFEAHRKLNRTRLMEEIKFAFTMDGVHKENSPGYQKMMLVRLRQLAEFDQLEESVIWDLGQKYIKSATKFLSAITLPDGTLPVIGDTRCGDQGIPYKQCQDIDIIDYGNSGYIIVRGRVLGKDFHLLFKNSHFSHYHRHDDDMSIHLYFGTTTLLGDGGLGSHNEKDPKRIAIRSVHSHNSPYIADGKPARVVSDLNGWTPRTIIDNNIIVGESFCYGFAIRREVDLSNISSGIINIKDTCAAIPGHKLCANFFSTKGFTKGEGCISIQDNNGNYLKISGENIKFSSADSIFSKKFGSFEGVESVISCGNGVGSFNRIELLLELKSMNS